MSTAKLQLPADPLQPTPPDAEAHPASEAIKELREAIAFLTELVVKLAVDSYQSRLEHKDLRRCVGILWDQAEKNAPRRQKRRRRPLPNADLGLTSLEKQRFDEVNERHKSFSQVAREEGRGASRQAIEQSIVSACKKIDRVTGINYLPEIRSRNAATKGRPGRPKQL